MFRLASPLSVKLGIALGFVHLLSVLMIVWYLLATDVDAQWQLIWVPLLLVDFPVSLVVVFSNELLSGLTSPWASYPASEFHGFVVPAIVHGLLGSLWWLFLPVAVSSAWTAIHAKWRNGN